MTKCVMLVIATLGLACFTLVLVLRDNPVSAPVVEKPQSSASPSEDSVCCYQFTEAGSEETLTDKSIYQLGSSWIRHDSQTIKLRQFRGKVQVIAMIFTHCPSSCPRLVADMKHLESNLQARYRD